MPGPKRTSKAPKRTARSRDTREIWLLHLVQAPFLVGDEEERPWLLLIVARESGLVVCLEVLERPAPKVVAKKITASIEKVDEGARPVEIVSEDPILVEALAELLAVPVRQGPTPEVGPVFESLSGYLDEVAARGGPGAPRPTSGDRFLLGGKRPTAASRALFAAVADLYRAAPWKTLSDGEIFQIDSPDPGLDGNVVSVIGTLGQNLGLLLYRSRDDFDRFRALAETFDDGAPPPRASRSSKPLIYLALDFNPRDELSPAARRALDQSDLPLGGAAAVPFAYRVKDVRGMDPVEPEEARRLALVAEAVAALWREHGAMFRKEAAQERVLSIVSFEHASAELGRVVLRGPTPCELDELDEEAPTRHFNLRLEVPLVRPASTPRAARNAPCPCGSRKKYKLCHEADDQTSAARSIGDLRYLRTRLDVEIARFGRALFGDDLFDEPGVLFADISDPDEVIAPLLLSLALYHFPWETEDDKTTAELFAEEARPLDHIERATLAAHRAAWLSLWQVTAVVPGESVSLRDLLTNVTRTAIERQGSRSLHVHEVVLAYVVEFPESTQIYGMYGRALPPGLGEEIATEARNLLAHRKKAARGRAATKKPKAKAKSRIGKGEAAPLPIESLREFDAVVLIGSLFVQAMDALLSRPMPTLQTTSGEPMLPTTDHFTLDGSAGLIRAALEEVGFQTDDETPDGTLHMTLLEPGEGALFAGGRVVGHVEVTSDKLTVHTLSVARADRLRTTIEQALGARARHRLRAHADPVGQFKAAPPEGAQGAAPLDPAQLPPELRAELERRARAHWAEWVDLDLPALDGKTPRQAAASPSLRPRLERLLRELEHRTARDAGPFAPDVAALRRTLGV